MKKVNKSFPPNNLTEFAIQQPHSNWEEFRNINLSEDYKTIKALIFSDQGGLCAFCEEKPKEAYKQRIEHFHPKSDNTSQNHNWNLDWNNVIGVCLGGSDISLSAHPLPENLSCDAHKDRLINKGILPTSCEGHLLNPLYIPTVPCLFDLDKRTGELKAKKDYEKLHIEHNHYNTIEELIEKTIEYLNLNCDRLNQQRLAVLNQYNLALKKARVRQDVNFLPKLAEHWFRTKWPSFFTTRRILLSHYAEKHLTIQNYNG